ncbi:hypothetical protein SKAU_G00210530 [Synaphobranchus kaupii]|uniref:Uncharacterized protein n=1 Tax=Synaphobranchus kaupii TaxID=118154 RepID=A0A9Q1F8R9_SYNKA|nr:hypothetical protein SKAU_G00210530 [Synaphobranchus kaupii]
MHCVEEDALDAELLRAKVQTEELEEEEEEDDKKEEDDEMDCDLEPRPASVGLWLRIFAALQTGRGGS